VTRALRGKGKIKIMAIYHQSVKAVSRSSGRSSTASAAYRAGEKIIDLRTGEIFDFTKKGGVEHAEIILPENSVWKPTRSELWNAAELSEKRKDACVAREHEVALPKELNAEQRLELARTFAKDLADRHGCAVDVCIHAPGKDKGGKSNENYHAHILCTTRKVEGEGLAGKCLREQAGQKRSVDLEVERAAWAKHVNHSLAQAGHVERVDHRSLEAQGIDRTPTSHKGVAVTGMERRGIETDVGARLAAAQIEGAFERTLLAGLNTQITRTDLSLTAALNERAENERAAFERIGKNLAAAGRASAFTVADLSSIAQEHRATSAANRGIEQTIHATRHNEAARTIVEAVGAAVVRAIPQITRAIDKIERQQPRTIGPNERARLKAIEIAKQQRADSLKTPQDAPAIARDASAQVVPVKSLAEVFAASYEAFKRWVELQTGRLREIKPESSDHRGWIKQADQHHAVQHLGSDGYAIHEQKKLSQPLVVGQWAEIKYRDGLGVVKIIDKTLSKGRGGIAD